MLKLSVFSGVCLFALPACTTLPLSKSLFQSSNLSDPITTTQAIHQLKVCDNQPESKACTHAIQHNLNIQSKHAKSIKPTQIHPVLNILYNGQQAQSLFLQRIPDIDTRADFFATNHLYFQHTNMPVKWFGASERISRRCVLGLGAKKCGSKVTFAIAKHTTNPQLYLWRQAVGDEILQQGFIKFKDLFNNHRQYTNPTAWDMTQLTQEQQIAQPLHQLYLTDYPLFIKLTKSVGVNMLNEQERVHYGKRLMGYNDCPR